MESEKLFREAMNSIELLKEAKIKGNWKPEYDTKITQLRAIIKEALGVLDSLIPPTNWPK